MPDFIIAGAMKAGTSTLHHLLNSHPGVFIPDREIHFFDLDDFFQHPDFFLPSSRDFRVLDFDENREKYRRWYGRFFEQADDDRTVGEDSTTYLASTVAPERIVAMLPDVKIIIVLRDPVERTYSHYWHLVRTGRAVSGFEESLRRGHGTLIQRSCYREQVERYLQHFPSRNVEFVLFERFIEDIQKAVDGLCEFLEVPASLDVDELGTHRNPSRYPRSLTLQLALNRCSPDHRPGVPRDHLPGAPTDDGPGVLGRVRYSVLGILSRANFWNEKPKPSLAPDTREFLRQFFRRQNEGLGKITGLPVDEYWSG